MEIKQLTYSAEKGARSYMEDFHHLSSTSRGTLLSVFDGHGGADVAEFCDKESWVVFGNLIDSGTSPTDALFETIAQLSERIDANPYFESGTTASMVFIDSGRSEAIVAVIGDSPVVIHNPTKGTWFGPDHNVRTNPAEMNAAIERGGHMYGGYICNSNGVGLQMGRALGDKALKGILSRTPEVFVVDIEEGGWILVGTDGLFDPSHHSEKSLQDTVKLIIDFPNVTAQELVNAAVAAQTGDNVTAILARL